MKQKLKPAERLLIALFVSIFTFSAVVSAAPQSSGFLHAYEAESFLGPVLASLPRDVSKVSETFVPAHCSVGQADCPVILHIQDAHANPEAQKHIQEIIEAVYRRFGNVRIAVENAEGPLDPEIFNRSPIDPVMREKIVQALANEGELTGAELFLLDLYREGKEKPAHVPVLGVEDQALYFKNLDRYLTLLQNRKTIDASFSKLNDLFVRTKSLHFNPALKQFDDERKAHSQNRRELLSYLKTLNARAQSILNTDLSDPIEQLRFPNLTRLARLGQLEESWKDEELSEERAQLEAELLKRGGSSDVIAELIQSIKALSQKPEKFGVDFKIAPRLLLEQMEFFARRHQVNLASYSRLIRFVSFQVLQSEINAVELFGEIHHLENSILGRLAESAEEKKLVEIGRSMALLQKMLHGEVTRADKERFSEQQNQIGPAAIVGELFELNPKISSTIRADMIQPIELLKRFLSASAEFYHGAEAREHAMIDKALQMLPKRNSFTLSEIQNSNRQVLVLISGGYHTGGFEQILEAKQIPYVVVSPRMFLPIDDQMYARVMLGRDDEISGLSSGTAQNIFRPLLTWNINSAHRNQTLVRLQESLQAHESRSELRADQPNVRFLSRTAEAEVMQFVQDIKKRFENKYYKFIEEPKILEGVAAFFGLNEENDLLLHEKAKQILSYLIKKTKREVKEMYRSQIVEALTKVTRHSTGAHRFMPLALAVVNMFRGQNIFSSDIISELVAIDNSFEYLRNTDHLYANPFNVESNWISDHLPKLAIPRIPSKRVYRWLDIGSGPKLDGAPTLHLLNETFKSALPDARFEFVGTDNFFPAYSFDDESVLFFTGRISSSPFNSDAFRKSGKMNLADVTYLDANFPQNNVMDERSMEGMFKDGPFDFISLSMALHFLREPDEEIKKLALSSNKGEDQFEFYDESGSRIRPTPTYLLTETQRRVIWRLMRNLSDNGILFLNLPWGPEYAKNHNLDLFLIIQRENAVAFKLYTQAIPFRPTLRKFSSGDYLTVGYQGKEKMGTVYHSPGIFHLYPGRDEAFYNQVRTFLHIADIMVYRHQERDKSAWSSVMRAAEQIANHASLEEIFRSYMANVPDHEVTKGLILNKVQQLEKTVTDSRSELRFSFQDVVEELQAIIDASQRAGFTPVPEFLKTQHPNLSADLSRIGELTSVLHAITFPNTQKPQPVVGQVVKVIDAQDFDPAQYQSVMDDLIDRGVKLVLAVQNHNPQTFKAIKNKLNQLLIKAAQEKGFAPDDVINRLAVESFSSATAQEIQKLIATRDLINASAVISEDSSILENVRSALRFLDDTRHEPELSAVALKEVVKAVTNPKAVQNRFGVISLSDWLSTKLTVILGERQAAISA